MNSRSEDNAGLFRSMRQAKSAVLTPLMVWAYAMHPHAALCQLQTRRVRIGAAATSVQGGSVQPVVVHGCGGRGLWWHLAARALHNRPPKSQGNDGR
jgi:hypothetical protein